MIIFNQFFIVYAISIPVFIIIDLLWLGVIAKPFYQTRLSHLLGDVNWVATIIFYLVFLLGLTFFAIYPTVARGTMMTGLILGGLFGFFTYATYDLTNWATLRGWPVSVVVFDMLWGTLLGAAVTAITYLLHLKIFS